MREFVITTESNADLSPEFVAANGIRVIPHYYKVEEVEYGGEGNELPIKEFYDEMRAGKKVGTMASNPAVIEEIFNDILSQGKDVLHISFSSALSGGCANVQMVGRQMMEEHPEFSVIVVDTLSASAGEALMIIKALECQKEGRSLAETEAIIKELVPHICVQFTVEDLEYLRRGGRLSKTSAVLGTMINLKPILHINDEGGLVALAKVRGRKKSIATMLDNMEERLGTFKDRQIAIGILHGDCEEEALAIKEKITERFGYTEFVLCQIGAAIGAHSGPGTLGLIFLGDYR